MDNTQPMQQATQQQAQPSPTPEDLLAATNQALVKKNKTQETNQNQAAISQAMAMLNPNGRDSTTQIGKSIQTPNYAGYCLQWVDDKQGNQNRYPTAIADYQAHAQAGDINTSGKIPQGARIYFSQNESNAGMGHVGIANSDGTFTSATDNGVKTYSIKDWVRSTGQSLLGWTKGQ